MRKTTVNHRAFFGLFRWTEQRHTVTSQELVDGAAEQSSDELTRHYRHCPVCNKDTLIRRKEFIVGYDPGGLGGWDITAPVSMCSVCGMLHNPDAAHKIEPRYYRAKA